MTPSVVLIQSVALEYCWHVVNLNSFPFNWRLKKKIQLPQISHESLGARGSNPVYLETYWNILTCRKYTKTKPMLQGPSFHHEVPGNISWNIIYLMSDPIAAVSFVFFLEKTKPNSKGYRKKIWIVALFKWRPQPAVSIICYCGNGLSSISAHLGLSLG